MCIRDSIDTISISLNGSTPEEYCAVTKPRQGVQAWDAMLDFAPTGGAEKGTLCRVPLGAGGNAAGRGGQGQYRPSAGCHGRPAQKGTGAIANGDADKLLWDKMSQSRVWGGSPTSVFAARRDAKKASVATLALLAVSASPGNPAKNGGGVIGLARFPLFSVGLFCGII